MPALPCVSCKNLVDTHDPACRKCNEKQPFACSKCNRRLATNELYEPEKLAFKKTPFCSRCGEENEVIQCTQCKTGLVKATGRTRTGSGGRELVYHEDCWKQYEKQDRISKMLLGLGAPAVGIVFGLLSLFFNHNSGTALEIGGGAAIAMIIGGIITKPRG